MTIRIEYIEDNGVPAAFFVNDINEIRTPLFYSREFGRLGVSQALSNHLVDEDEAMRLINGLNVSELPGDLTELDATTAVMANMVPHIECEAPTVH